MPQFIVVIITAMILGWQLCRLEVITSGDTAWPYTKILLLMFIINIILLLSGWYIPLIKALTSIGG